MLFNSFPFLFVFLPVALAGYYACAMLGKSVTRLWLVLVSFAFYMWWHPAFVVILATSIAFNYVCGISIQRLRDKPGVGHQAWADGVLLPLLYPTFVCSVEHLASIATY